MDAKAVIECVREFPLRQQYPSVVPELASKYLTKKQIATSLCLESLFSTKIKPLPKSDVNVKSNYRKLRLRSQSGIDLGEFNAQVVSLNNMTESKSLQLKQTKFKKSNKSVLLSSLMSKDNSKKLLTLIPIQSMKVNEDITKLSNQTNVTSEPDDNGDNKTCKPKTIIIKQVTINESCHKKIQNANIVETDNCKNNESNKKGELECNKTQSLLVENENNLKMKGNCNVKLSEKIEELVNNNSLSELSKSTSLDKSKNIIDSMISPIAFSNKLLNTTSNENKIIDKSLDLGNFESYNDEIFNNNKILLSPINNEDNTDVSSKEKLPKLIEKNFDHFELSQKQALTILRDEMNNKSECKRISDPNVDKQSLDDNLNKNYNFDGQLFPIRRTNNNISVNTKTSDRENCTSENINDKLSKNLNLPRQLSVNWRLVNEIISSIKDKEDKEKAIKILRKYIIMKQDLLAELEPLDVEKLQIDLLLDSENVPITNENRFNISTIKLKESGPANTMENINQRSNIYNDLPMPFLNRSQESNEYLKKLTKDICNKNSGANKVQQILSQTNTFHSKIFEQLQKDFATATQLDENGFLNIHKAVINNRICDVQRYLMVLKACSIDVDIPTEFKMTSLELAIKYNVSTEIVKLLLEYGANPVSSKQIHESALIIASKENHALLPELIKHVANVELINNVDHMGFAPLHYCAQTGNLKGVTSLINMGADINLRESRFGRTAFFLAMENNHHIIAIKLMNHGANVHIPNFSGQTFMPLGDKINL